ncbi:hypothetical protein [Cohnella silvisoli]|uniref:Uncharacterized protein n=1 Tax=Cohnella silvisoli TaxID=2873699 RepID=A0ABV1L2B1_9BACL|nr:hypothetical protein [Cohnella silvisoli]MCD9025775.1 hypothetical protein [Cohnella silvisoli]
MSAKVYTFTRRSSANRSKPLMCELKPKVTPKSPQSPSPKARHRAWIAEWKGRIKAARSNGAARRRSYQGKPLRIYDISFTRPSGHRWHLTIDGRIDDDDARSYVRTNYHAVEIHHLRHIGYMPIPKDRPDKPKLEMELT